MGVYPVSMDTNTFIKILLVVYVVALLSIDFVAYRIALLKMQLEQ